MAVGRSPALTGVVEKDMVGSALGVANAAGVGLDTIDPAAVSASFGVAESCVNCGACVQADTANNKKISANEARDRNMTTLLSFILTETELLLELFQEKAQPSRWAR